MSESINMQRIHLVQSLQHIAQQDIPVLSTNLSHILFVQRKTAAIEYLKGKLSEIAQEELLYYIEYCNENIKKYLAL
jgi:hypothetical protein